MLSSTILLFLAGFFSNNSAECHQHKSELGYRCCQPYHPHVHHHHGHPPTGPHDFQPPYNYHNNEGHPSGHSDRAPEHKHYPNMEYDSEVDQKNDAGRDGTESITVANRFNSERRIQRKNFGEKDLEVHHGPPPTGPHDIPSLYNYKNNEGHSDRAPEHKHHPNTEYDSEIDRKNAEGRDETESITVGNRFNSERRMQRKNFGDKDSEIPLELLEKLEKWDTGKILDQLIEGMPETPITIGNRYGEVEATQVNSKCAPENVTVSFGDPGGWNLFYIPSCIKIEQCGGCCSKNFRSCQPTKTETIRIKVIEAEYNGRSKLGHLSDKFVELKKHLACECGCIIKPEDCKSNQKHNSSRCACECTNDEDEIECSKNPTMKIWNDETCTCNCRNITECSTGSNYDHNECRCKITPMERYSS